MDKQYKEIIIELCGEIHNLVIEYSSRKLNMFQKSELAEAYFAIESVLGNKFIEAHERVILERDLAKIYKIVYSEESLFYYSSFHYAYSTIKEGDTNRIQNQFHKINLDTAAMLVKMRSISKGHNDLGDSTDNYFFSRMENCTWAFSYVKRNNLKNFYTPSLYCICNLIQTLSLYQSIGKTKYREKIVPLIDLLSTQLREFLSDDDVLDIIDNNQQLKLFIENQRKNISVIKNDTYEINDIILDDISKEDSKSSLRILTNLFNLNIEMFKEYYELKSGYLVNQINRMSNLEKILFLRNTSDYIRIKYAHTDIFEIGLYEKIKKIDTNDLLNEIFDIEAINLKEVTDEKMQKLLQMKDDQLRINFSKTIKNVPTRILDRESKKPHGSFEISDMEVPVTYRGNKLFMCIPFKSGVEIKSKTVPVEVAYQIMRPFIEFENCFVVFVTAKKCSENLMNYIKKLKDKQGWPIEVLEDKTLAALLIKNEQL